MSRFFALAGVALLAGLFVATGCGDGSSSETPKAGEPDAAGAFQVAIASSDHAVGQQRVAFALIKDGKPLEDQIVYVRFFKVDADGGARVLGGTAIPWSPLGVPTASGHATHADTELRGVYFANIAFDAAGSYGLGVTLGEKPDDQAEVRTRVEVAATPVTPAIGARAPLTRNPTLKNAPIKQIDTSDPHDEGMHQLSIAEAVTSGRPSVIAFATPAFCQSRTCGPVMDVVGFVQREYGTRVNFVHVEPFKLSETGELQVSPNGTPTLSDAAASWRLPTEPWVFVIDATGVVVARFSGPLALEELQYALSQVVG